MWQKHSLYHSQFYHVPRTALSNMSTPYQPELIGVEMEGNRRVTPLPPPVQLHSSAFPGPSSQTSVVIGPRGKVLQEHMLREQPVQSVKNGYGAPPTNIDAPTARNAKISAPDHRERDMAFGTPDTVYSRVRPVLFHPQKNAEPSTQFLKNNHLEHTGRLESNCSLATQTGSDSSFHSIRMPIISSPRDTQMVKHGIASSGVKRVQMHGTTEKDRITGDSEREGFPYLQNQALAQRSIPESQRDSQHPSTTFRASYGNIPGIPTPYSQQVLVSVPDCAMLRDNRDVYCYPRPVLDVHQQDLHSSANNAFSFAAKDTNSSAINDSSLRAPGDLRNLARQQFTHNQQASIATFENSPVYLYEEVAGTNLFDGVRQPFQRNESYPTPPYSTNQPTPLVSKAADKEQFILPGINSVQTVTDPNARETPTSQSQITKSVGRQSRVINQLDQERCKHCEKVFTTRKDKNRHMKRMHELRGRYPCPQGTCKKSFAEAHKLERHVNTVHLKKRPFKCPRCDSMFGERGNMTQHLKKKHLKQKVGSKKPIGSLRL